MLFNFKVSCWYAFKFGEQFYFKISSLLWIFKKYFDIIRTEIKETSEVLSTTIRRSTTRPNGDVDQIL